MMARISLIVVVLFFQCFLVFSQCISVELSVTWESGYDIFKKDSMVHIPKLHITYRNMSDVNLYFLKISNSRNGFPWIGCLISLHPHFSNFDDYLRWSRDYLARAKEHSNYANENFHVSIGGYGNPTLIRDWVVFSDSIYFGEEEIEEDMINCSLGKIYEYMYRNDNSENIGEKVYFSPSDVTPENIFSTVKDQFVFLKHNEVYIDTYNLIGFKLVEGYFTFIINQKGFADYVLIQPIWDNDKSCLIEQKTELPEKVGEYHLYSGAFFSNSVTVNFSKIFP